MSVEKYLVPIQVTLTLDVVVEAPSRLSAIQRAIYLTRDAMPDTVKVLGTLNQASVGSNTAFHAPDDARLLTYRCESCGKTSFKRDFGAGGQTCPRCGQAPVSAQEFHAQQIGDAP
jgi:ribosomal protein S27AE